MYITITALDFYMGSETLSPGMIMMLKKDVNNEYDDEAIAVVSNKEIKYGYVANSVKTVARGSHSAGYVYQMVENGTKIEIMFVMENRAIARILEEKEA